MAGADLQESSASSSRNTLPIDRVFGKYAASVVQ